VLQKKKKKLRQAADHQLLTDEEGFQLQGHPSENSGG
jgi:hypothetical protein